MDDVLQRQRFELKFRIRPETALAVRDFVRCHLELDPFGATQPDFSYDIHSLYLDSDDLQLYHSTINGDRNRYKLRLRFYDKRPDAPVFFEIKRRANNCILKRRARVRAEAVPLLLEGAFPEAGFVLPPTAAQLGELHVFCERMWDIRARPCTLVSYRREAWVSPDPTGARVTFDRAVRAEPHVETRLDRGVPSSVPVFADEVVLELKFTDRFPGWLAEMVRAFGLVQTSAAKYVDGLVDLGERGVRPRADGLVEPLPVDATAKRRSAAKSGRDPIALVRSWTASWRPEAAAGTAWRLS